MSIFSRYSQTSQGILFMLACVTLFSLMDALAKVLGASVDVSLILWARYGVQLIVLVVIFRHRLPTYLHTQYPWLQLLRGIFQLLAAGCFFISLKTLGLSEATAVADLSPVLITLGAAVILGEKIGLRRALAVAAALVGALIVIRPGGAVFSMSSLWPLGTAVCLAGYAIATRFIGKSESPVTGLLYSGLFSTFILSIVVPLRWTPPETEAIPLLLMVGLMGTMAQFLMIRAYMAAEASMVAPFSYAGLITATLWGVLFFGQWPDLWTVVGALVIVGAGLYVWQRETHLARSDALRHLDRADGDEI